MKIYFLLRSEQVTDCDWNAKVASEFINKATLNAPLQIDFYGDCGNLSKQDIFHK